jgi:hypothetical protein
MQVWRGRSLSYLWRMLFSRLRAAECKAQRKHRDSLCQQLQLSNGTVIVCPPSKAPSKVSSHGDASDNSDFPFLHRRAAAKAERPLLAAADRDAIELQNNVRVDEIVEV